MRMPTLGGRSRVGATACPGAVGTTASGVRDVRRRSVARILIAPCASETSPGHRWAVAVLGNGGRGRAGGGGAGSGSTSRSRRSCSACRCPCSRSGVRSTISVPRCAGPAHGTDAASFVVNEVLAGVGLAAVLVVAVPVSRLVVPDALTRTLVAQPAQARWLEAFAISEVGGYWGHGSATRSRSCGASTGSTTPHRSSTGRHRAAATPSTPSSPARRPRCPSSCSGWRSRRSSPGSR